MDKSVKQVKPLWRRAPKGYRIQQWADGFYHVYRGAAGTECIGEYLRRGEAIQAAREDMLRVRR